MNKDQIPEQIEGIDVQAGITNSGSEEIFLRGLIDFYKLIENKSSKIESCMLEGKVRELIIEVHGLKNTARMIGALELSERFKKVEEMEGHFDDEEIFESADQVLAYYKSFIDILKPIADSDNDEKKHISKDDFISLLTTLKEAMDDFNLDGADKTMKELNSVVIPDALVSGIKELDALVADVAMEEVINLTEKLIKESANCF